LQKAQNFVVPARAPEEGETAEQVEQERAEEQARIDNGPFYSLLPGLS
jgi:SWI/SNF-related matrix-associated actin-dependent regulator of chromatin subfamily A member 5